MEFYRESFNQRKFVAHSLREVSRRDSFVSYLSSLICVFILHFCLVDELPTNERLSDPAPPAVHLHQLIIPLHFVQTCVFQPRGETKPAMVVITVGSCPLLPLPPPPPHASPSTSPGQFADLKCGKFANLRREVNCVC